MQNLSLDLLKKKLKRYPHHNELETFINRIEKENLKLILLYGSLAKGTYTQHSDIDVLCVFDKEFRDMKERFLTSYKYSEGLVQPKTLSYEEFKRSLKNGNSFLHSIIQESYILFNKIPEDKLVKWIKQGKKNLKVKFVPPS
ncbi:MAG: nucleotidyltransferase domain-containing protein [Promethearchaeota archaeon]|nr:MAG: nucleotidyltransferase domain-containing protein [Candidatus Lokiarchaeota archaeon]